MIQNVDTQFLKSLLSPVKKMARQAGKAILEVYETDFEVNNKADNSPVTEADEAAERIIIKELLRLTPEIPIIAEEAVAAGNIPDVSEGLFWLVDPLDGTKEFVSRNGQFTVNIALVKDKRPIFGVVFSPVLDEMYSGYGKGTACLEKQGENREISTRKPLKEGMVVLASKHHSNQKELEEFLADYKISNVINAGSSLKFCTIARGDADIYPRLGPTKEWDTAAGHAVLTSAGGRVETTDGKEFMYNKKNFINPYFVAFGR